MEIKYYNNLNPHWFGRAILAICWIINKTGFPQTTSRAGGIACASTLWQPHPPSSVPPAQAFLPSITTQAQLPFYTVRPGFLSNVIFSLFCPWWLKISPRSLSVSVLLHSLCSFGLGFPAHVSASPVLSHPSPSSAITYPRPAAPVSIPSPA